MKSTLIGAFLVLLIALPAKSGQIKTWTDEEGVTHIEVEGYNTRKTSHSRPKRYKSSKQFEIEQQKRVRKRELERERERKEGKRKYEKEDREREIKQAKEKWERLLKSESRYRRNYNKAYNREDMEYWWNKLQEIDEARSEYLKLRNQ
jgi:Skp family chaperone for outer membrane proteins